MSHPSLQRQLEVILEAPNGVQKLRELILQLAVRGQLVAQDPAEASAHLLLEEIAAEKHRRGAKRGVGTPKDSGPAAHVELPDLPAGWAWICLADLGEFCGGGTPSKNITNYWDGEVPWISPKDMKADYISTSEDTITERAVTERRLRLIPAKSILIVTRSGILRRTLPVAINEMPCTVNQDIKALIPYRPGLEEYLRVLLKGHERQVLRDLVKGGTTVQSVVFDAFKEHPFPFPPLEEQRRIIARVVELMALCDQLEARHRRRADARAQLNRSLLHHLTTAADGARLAACWQSLRENFGVLYDTPETVADLRLLFVDLAMRGRLLPHPSDVAAAVKSGGSPDELIESAPPLPARWRWEPISALGADPANPVQTGPFGAQLHKTEFVDTGVPVIAVGNLTGRGFTTEGLYFITPEKAAALARYDVRHGDILFARSGATLGKVCVAPEFVDDWRMTGHILRARLNPALANPHFVVYALWGARIVREQVMAGVQGTTRPGYNTSLLERILLPVPPRAEQESIVSKLDELMSLCDRLEAQLAGAYEQSDRLAAAVVHHLTAA